MVEIVTRKWHDCAIITGSCVSLVVDNVIRCTQYCPGEVDGIGRPDFCAVHAGGFQEMDKNKKKLTLDTQTVRRLTKDELNHVRGGYVMEDADAACSSSRTCADSTGGTARSCRN